MYLKIKHYEYKLRSYPKIDAFKNVYIGYPDIL